MHVFLAGATGVIGRRIVPLLLAEGHRVTGLTRDTRSSDRLRALGAEAVLGDAKDAEQMMRAVRAARPDVLMNQLTDLSSGIGPANSELRRASSAALSSAAEAAGVRRVIAQSVAWAYGPGERAAQEGEVLDATAPDPRGNMVRAVADVEAGAAQSEEWVVLRYGLFYGPDTWYAPRGAKAEEARAGALAPDSDITSFIHVDDAARAAVAALEWPSGAVNVCDDEPASGHEWLPAFCATVGAPVPERGAPSARQSWARGADNTWLRAGLTFDLEYPTWRQGFAQDAAAIDTTTSAN